jgi:hypothetical protein
MDRARSIGTPVDLQPLAWIEPTRSAASEAVDLQPLARAKPIRSAAGEAGSRQPPALVEPAQSAHPVDLQPLARIESRRSAASEAPAADLQPLAWTKPARSAVASEAVDLQPAAACTDRARSIGTPVDLQPPVERARFAASNAIALQTPHGIEPAPSAYWSTCSRLHGSSPHDPLPARRPICSHRHGSSPFDRQ